jgi:hypothetical protein
MASFELERFGWSGESRLEVIGRWTGVRGRHAGAAVLSVEVDGGRRRVPAVVAGPLTDEPWQALFEWDGDPGDVREAELEVGRALVVALPAPRRRRRAAPAARAAVAPAATAPAAALDAAREQELAGLRLAHGSLRASHEQIEDEVETLRAARDERDRVAVALGAEVETLRAARDERDRIAAELERARLQLADAERERATLEARADAADAEAARLRARVALSEAELVAARADAAERVATERATVTEVHSRLATAREEAHGTIAAEAVETERLRAELDTTRTDAERLLADERAEVARLREALADGADADGEPEESAPRRMLERVSRDLERERAASRTLRRELDALQAEAAEHRRAVSSATASGVLGTDEQPVAVRTVHTPEGTRRRVSAARGHAAQRVPAVPPSAATLWTVRVVAVAAVAAVGIMLFILLSAIS